MITDILTYSFYLLMSLVFFVVKAILLPIDIAVQAVLPAFSDGLTSIAGFFTLIGNNLAWAIDATGIPTATLIFLSYHLIFKYTVPINIWLIKLAIKWYRTIRG